MSRSDPSAPLRRLSLPAHPRWQGDPVDLGAIERYYDTVPRAAATTEEVGPFTLFRAHPGLGWQFYARPRLGGGCAFRPEDVRRVLARQAELDVPRSIEWVAEVTPTLLPAVTRAGVGEVDRCPLLVLTEDAPVTAPWPAPGRVRRHQVMTPAHDDLPLVVGAVEAAFSDSDRPRPVVLGVHRLQIAEGLAIVVGAYDESGRVVGGGTAAPRGEVAELMGIGVLPHARHRGHGQAITRALVLAARAAGVRTCFLTAASDEAASSYRAVGFTRVATACILHATPAVDPPPGARVAPPAAMRPPG